MSVPQVQVVSAISHRDPQLQCFGDTTRHRVRIVAGSKVYMTKKSNRLSWHETFTITKILDEIQLARSTAETNLASAGDVLTGLQTIVGRLQTVMDVVDEASQIHPVVSVAWTFMSSVVKALGTQTEMDKKIAELVTAMNDAYSFVDTVESLNPLTRQLEEQIKATLQQTIECAMFIREYFGNGFMERTAINAFDGQASASIESFTKQFKYLQAARTESAIVHTMGISKVILGVTKATQGYVLDLIRAQALELALRPIDVNMADRPSCLPQTRTVLVTDISARMMAADEHNLVWVYGVAGCGKSTVATSLANFFRHQRRLGAFLSFDRESQASAPHHVVRILASQLARFDHAIEHELWQVVDQNPSITLSTIADQFRELIFEPLRNVVSHGTLSMIGPIVIILDGLDECGTTAEREQLFFTLKSQLPLLPKSVRILITSRAEVDIMRTLDNPDVDVQRVDMNAYPDTDQDIEAFFRVRLEAIRTKNQYLDLPESWPEEEEIVSLVEHAAGLFVWASTICHMIEVAHDPDGRLQSVLEGERSAADTVMDTLYETSLRKSDCDWTDETFVHSFRSIFGVILMGESPITTAVIDGLLGKSLPALSMHTIQHFHVLLSISPEGAISTLHPSLYRFLTDDDRRDAKWYIDPIWHRRQLTFRCLNYVQKRFPRRRTLAEVTDFHKLCEGMSDPLKHASSHWMDYVTLLECKTDGDPVLHKHLSRFFMGAFEDWYNVHAIYWGEAILLSYLDQTLVRWLMVNGKKILGETGSVVVHHWLRGINATRDLRSLDHADQASAVKVIIVSAGTGEV
ncbi:hypothetical protein EUX98_g8470 [Antrodiella citrinella]|uniref:NACHT domain-containing protein n=1 Tax=Antrodiella citrinella TaxID=2447956 RepID=A0A4S4M7F2_9APHY|nr:hypothetical protein EUX98_g8470 [Antrodiella citrinella]